jgi:hypothetical protein
MSNAARVPDLPGIVASVSGRPPQFRRAQELGGLPLRLSAVSPSSPTSSWPADYMDGLGVAHATGRLPAVVRAPG